MFETLKPLNPALIKNYCLCIFIVLATTILILVYEVSWRIGFSNITLSSLYIPSVDEIWYSEQYRSWKDFGLFAIDPNDLNTSVRRVPIYPLFVGFVRELFGEAYYRVTIVSLQVTLHLVATLFIARICILVGFQSASLLCAYLYGLNPLILGFLMIPITEGLSPSLITFFIFLSLWSLKERSAPLFFFVGIVCAVSILVSPRNGIALIFLVPFFLRPLLDFDFPRQILSSIFALSIGISVIITPWAIRNWVNISELITLERYYGHHTFGDEGEKNFGVFEWWHAWGDARGIELHHLIMGTTEGEFDLKLGTWLDETVPSWVVKVNGRQRLLDTFKRYKVCGLEVQTSLSGLPRFRRQDPQPSCEKELRDVFLSFRADLVEATPFRVHIAVVFYRLKLYVFQSTVHVWTKVASQTNAIDFSIKSYGYLLNVLNFLSILFVLFSKRLRQKLSQFVYPIMFLLIFILYARHVEARYIIQMYPFTTILLAIVMTVGLRKRSSMVFRS